MLLPINIDATLFNDPKFQRLRRPTLLKLLADFGIVPVVVETTGEIRVPVSTMAAAFGMSEADLLASADPNGTPAFYITPCVTPAGDGGLIVEVA
jgi:hypothetical protein